MEKSDKKNNVLVHKGVEPVTFLSFHKTLPTEPRAQCDMELHPFDKILILRKSLKNKKMAGRPLLCSSFNSDTKPTLSCSFLNGFEKCKHEFYSFLNKEHDGNFQYC